MSFYLTNILYSEKKKDSYESIFFCQDEIPPHVHFHGTNIGLSRAKKYFSFDQVFPFDKFKDVYLKLKEEPNLNIFVDIDSNSCIDQSFSCSFDCNCYLEFHLGDKCF